jgi:alpha-galactosidase|eukprot:COSAG01_NODE_8257_length_2855_cov_1.642598_2_plen_131_part_00
MRDALNRTQRRVVFSVEPFDLTPNPQAHIANLWRTTTDVADTTAKVRVNIDLNDKWAEFAGPGGFNDPDMLQVGKGKSSLNEWRTNFILWAIAKAPLLLSTNITALAAAHPSLLPLLTHEVRCSCRDSGP